LKEAALDDRMNFMEEAVLEEIMASFFQIFALGF
jgi:hypothetical protein